MRQAVVLVFLAMTLSACSEPLEFADWTIHVPEGTPIIEYAPVALDDRDPDAIRLVEDLVIGADTSDPDAGVFQPTAVVATESGLIFVADSATRAIQMYDRDGGYLKTLGGEGQGPGEFETFSGMTIAGDLLVVQDRRNRRYSTWTLDGEHAGDFRKTSREWRRPMYGLADHTFVAQTIVEDLDGGSRIIGRHALDGAEVARFDEVDMPPAIRFNPGWTRGDIARAFMNLLDRPVRTVVVGARNIVYVSPTNEYQVLTMSADGTPLWALRVAWSAPPFPAGEKAAVVAQAQRSGDPGITVGDFDWPAESYAIAALLTDGAGRLYVFPNVDFGDEPLSEAPVDVYSPDGELVVAGFVPVRWAEPPYRFARPWSYGVGDYVYGLREDEHGERVAVRYRLVLPGER